MIAVTISQASAGIVVAVIALVPAYWGYKQAQKVDKRTEQAGMATQATVSTGQVLHAFNNIVERLGDDNKQLREQVVALLARLDEQGAQFRDEIRVLEEKLDDQNQLIADLRVELAAYQRRNGIDLSDSST